MFKIITRVTLLFSIFIVQNKILAQTQTISGLVIKNNGAFYPVENLDFPTDLSQKFKVVFDVGRQFPDSSRINPLINTAARFLNMHANTGVPINQMKIALVIHGGAVYDILNDINYKQKYLCDNPNTNLLNELNQAGVQIIICGQSASYKNIFKQELNSNAKLALSAMTALVQLQNNGFRLINF